MDPTKPSYEDLVLELERQKQENERQKRENERQKRENERQKRENEELREKIEKIERFLRLNSTNSSKAPSTDKPGTRKKKRKKAKKPGPKKGHEGKARKKLPAEKVNRTEKCALVQKECACGGLLHKGEGFVHQVVDLFEVVEYEVERGRCGRCRKWTSAPFPAGVTSSILGPELLAMMTYSSGVLGVTRRKLQRFLSEVFRIELSLGTISNAEKEASAALSKGCDEVIEATRAAEVAHFDETGHRKKGERFTTWVFSTALTTWIVVGRDRSRQTFLDLRQGFLGVGVTDRYAGYTVDDFSQQFCLEHLRRNFLALVDEKGVEAEALMCVRAIQRVLVAWRDFRERRIHFITAQHTARRCRRRIEETLSNISFENLFSVPALRGLAHALFLTPEKVWRFVDDVRVPPTNNMGERDIRDFVIRRKISLHTWSERGDLFLSRALSIAGTCRKLGKSPYTYLLSAVKAFRQGMAVPRLV